MNSTTTLGQVICKSLIESNQSEAVRCDDKALSSYEFLSCVEQRQTTLKQYGIKEQSRVLLASGRGLDYWVDMVCLWTLGAVVIPLDPMMQPIRFDTFMEKADPKFVLGNFALEKDYPQLTIINDDIATATSKITVDVLSHSAESDAAILFTSGSTGAPKGVRLSHVSVLGNAQAMIQQLDLRDDDRLFISIPFHFTSAICHFLAATLSGITFISTEATLFQSDLYHALEKHKATAFGGAPIQLRWISECAEDKPLPLRWLMSSGDRLNIDIIKKLRSSLPAASVYTVYGLTEVGGRLCVLPAEKIDDFAGSVGKPIQGMQVSVLDENGKSLPAGEEGDIYVKGPFVFSEYINDPEKTEKALTAFGFKTGDYGYLSEQGFLYLRGRVDDVFKSAGQKISAIAIQEALFATNEFEDIVVYPGEDPMVGTVPFAYYVLKQDKEFNKGLVLRQIRRQLPKNHLPKSFVEIDNIPRTGSGKLDRVAFREKIANQAA